MESSNVNRRNFIRTSLGAAALAAINPTQLLAAKGSRTSITKSSNALDYRIAYGCWVNDMRLESLALEDWPAEQMDDETVRSVFKALDVQSHFKYNWLDTWGLLATTSWPLNLGEGVDNDRRRRVKKILAHAHERGIKVIYGMGVMSWGYEKIIENNPSLTAINRDGSLNKQAMCDAHPESFEWVKKILDFVLSEFDFNGLHLESMDQGGCFCPYCAGKAGVVEYHSRINGKTADYIRSKWPEKLINVIPINWAMDSKGHFTESDKKEIIELSNHIDGFYDQGWHGTYIPSEERSAFITQLHCAYGTSGGRWVYPGQRWDRESFFIPHMRHQATAIKEQFAQGARGILHYQGPVNNPGTEVNIACGGLMSSDTSQTIEDVVAKVIEDLYRPQNVSAHKKLTQIFLNGEEAYFGHWGKNDAGETYMDLLVGDSPGPAAYLMQYLDGAGRLAYKKDLIPLLRDLKGIEMSFNDGGRIKALKRSMMITLTLLNTIMYAKGEPMDPNKGLNQSRIHTNFWKRINTIQ
ncbi:MAG: hypothetical protein WCS03_15580 [Bacteroidota bacterium]